MSNNWLFFPTPASGADWSDAWVSSDFLGSCVADGNAFSLSNPFSLVTGWIVGNVGTTQQFQRAGGNTIDTKGPSYVNLWYGKGMRYMVWFLQGLGWQKSPYMSVWYANSRTAWAVSTDFYQYGYDVGDYAPIVFAAFIGDPGDVSTWTDYNGPTGYHQEITWTMTGAADATVSSTGQDIIKNNQTAFLNWGDGKPRLINGTESQNFGANGSNTFPTNAACRTWWDNYQVEGEKNGGGFVSIGNPVSGSAQDAYINANSTAMPGWGTAFVSGDIVKFRISTAT